MGWVDLPLATQSGEAPSKITSDMDLINLEVIPNPPGSPKPFTVVHTPPILSTQITMGGSGLIRGLCRHGTNLFYVRATELYRMSDSGTSTLVGTVAGTAYCQMVSAGTHVLIADGTNTYAATTAAVTTVTMPAGTCKDVAYQNGYSVYTRSGTDEWYVSSLDDPTTIGALDFTTADAQAGNIIGCASVNNQVVILKETTTEFYDNVGGSGFPFQRSQPGVIERGCYAAGSIAKHDVGGVGSLYFVGDDLRVYALRGYQAIRVSTPWIERRIRALLPYGLSATNTRASTYTYEGHSYYFLSIDSLGGTLQRATHLCLNIDTGLWHERISPLSGSSRVKYIGIVSWPSGATFQNYAACNNPTSGSIYWLPGSDYFDLGGTFNDAGASSQTSRVMTLPPVLSGGRRAFMAELAMEAETAGAASTIDLQWADDGSSTYTTTGSHNGDGTASVVRWQRLGSFRKSRSLRFTLATNSRVAITGVRARIEGGAS